MAFQAPRLLPWRTLVQNICLVPGSGDEARARRLLAEVGLAEAADAYPETVSLGMQRRAALARALSVEPALMLLDEPLASLDSETAGAMRSLLRHAFARSGATVLLTTHDRREALSLADRVIELAGRPAVIAADRVSPIGREQRGDRARVEALHAAWYGDR